MIMSHKKPNCGSTSGLAHALAARLLQDKNYTLSGAFPRHSDTDSDRFGYFGGTLATARTIPTRLILQHRILQPPLPTSPPWPDSKTRTSLAQPSVHPADIIVVLELGTPGVSGHPSTAHGGVLASCFDETMHKAVAAHLVDTRHVAKPYTARLDIRYRQPVQVPGLLIIRAKVVARTGRKFWVRAVASQQRDDAKETPTTDAMALFLGVGDSISSRL
ncbi:HotDog domain-containing protein [Aspergillus pseudoustus]|uniref:HotDog domain-containing protein n=1 Tax=Aspergillus pseudoustus TaxID=1810923 RepID=A0ABR4L2F9_9EURO